MNERGQDALALDICLLLNAQPPLATRAGDQFREDYVPVEDGHEDRCVCVCVWLTVNVIYYIIYGPLIHTLCFRCMQQSGSIVAVWRSERRKRTHNGFSIAIIGRMVRYYE